FSGSTGCTTKREAERYEEDLKRQLKAVTADRKKPMTFMTASTLYWQERGQFLANSLDTERYLAWLQENIGRNTQISTITDATVAKLVAKRRSDGVSNATVNRSVCSPLRAIMNRARKT